MALIELSARPLLQDTKHTQGKRRRSTQGKKYAWFFLSILPAFVLFSLFVVYPIVSAFTLSFTNYDGFTGVSRWIGLNNYIELFTQDVATAEAVRHNLIYAFFYVLVLPALALFFALLLDRNIRGRNLYRAIFFLPVVVSPVAVSFAWSFIYDPLTGSLNTFLRAIGLGMLAQDWLGNYSLALYSVIFVDMWKNIGFSLVLFLAGLQTIPGEMLEAAVVDGASAWSRFRHIIFPLLWPTTGIVLVLSANGALRAFDMVYLLTQGGPGTQTQLYTTRLFQEAFADNRYGYASAMAWVVFVALLLIAAVQSYFAREHKPRTRKGRS